MLGLKVFFINSDKFLTATRVFSKRIVGNSIEPCGKTRFAAKAADVFVSAQKCLLGEIVRKRKIRSGELAKQTPHAGLMPSDQLAESVLIIINKNSGDEVCIGQLHGRRLRYRRRIVLPSFQLPHEQITRANKKWNKANAPRATLPIVHGGQENHETEADHHQYYTTAHIGTLTVCGRRIQQGRRHFLTFFHHQTDGAVQSSRLGKTKIHDHRDDQHRSAKDSHHRNYDNWDYIRRNVTVM